MVQSSFQLSTGILFEPIMKDFAITSFYASLLNSSYYYMYVILQVPAGLIMDKFGPRRLLSVGAFISSAGCLLFSLTHSYAWALAAKFVTGGAAAIAFVGVLYVIREWFSSAKKAILVSVAEILTMFSSIRGIFIIVLTLQYFNWRVCIQLYGLFFLIVSLGCGFFIKDINPARTTQNHHPKTHISFRKSLKTVLSDKIAWLNGLYIGLMYTVTTVFIALWATPFLSLHLETTAIKASKISLLTFVGVFIGCPLFGWLSQKYQTRRIFLLISGISSTLLLSFIIYWPTVSVVAESLALFLLGLTSSGYILSFLISDDISPNNVKNTYIGFTNACCMVTAPILQPMIGELLDIQLDAQNVYSCLHFQKAFIIMIIALLGATIIAWFLPETYVKRPRTPSRA